MVEDAAGDGDRPAWRLRLPRRDEPPHGPDGLPHGCRDEADALHRGRAQCAPAAPLRGQLARRSSALDVHRPARAAPAAGRDRHRDRRPALLARTRDGWSNGRSARGCPTAGSIPARVRAGGRDDREADTERAAARAAARRRRAAPAEQRRRRSRASVSVSSSRRARRSTYSSSAADRPASAPRSTAPRRASRRSSIESTVLGGQAGRLATDRELPRLPGRDQRHRADQSRGDAGAQVRRPHRDAVPRRRARARRRTPRRAARRRA